MAHNLPKGASRYLCTSTYAGRDCKSRPATNYSCGLSLPEMPAQVTWARYITSPASVSNSTHPGTMDKYTVPSLLAWPRPGESRGIWTSFLLTGSTQTGGLRLVDGERLCLMRSPLPLGCFSQGHARLGGPTWVCRKFKRVQRRCTWPFLWGNRGAAAFTHPGPRLRDRRHSLQFRYFLRPSPRGGDQVSHSSTTSSHLVGRDWPPGAGTLRSHPRPL